MVVKDTAGYTVNANGSRSIDPIDIVRNPKARKEIKAQATGAPVAEHQRLKDAVVEAAQAEICNATEDLTNAVDALNAFEASHAVGQKDE